MNLESFHAWLRGCLPCSASQIMADLQIGRKATPASYEGLPTNAIELLEAMQALAVRGLVEKDWAEWKWKAAAVKEPQAQLW